MRNFLRIAAGINVEQVLQELALAKDLWNEQPWRTHYTGTPHGDVDDIWLRYSDAKALTEGGVAAGVDAKPVWYPAALRLPAVRPLVLSLMFMTNSWSLERLIITRLKPGGRILKHQDNYGAYVHQPGIARYHTVLQGLGGSGFACGDEVVQMLTGEAWWFDASEPHEVLNNSASDRVHLIADTLRWPTSLATKL